MLKEIAVRPADDDEAWLKDDTDAEREDYRVVMVVGKGRDPDFTIRDMNGQRIGSTDDMTEPPAYPVGTSYTELYDDYKRMRRAFDRPFVVVDLGEPDEQADACLAPPTTTARVCIVTAQAWQDSVIEVCNNRAAYGFKSLDDVAKAFGISKSTVYRMRYPDKAADQIERQNDIDLKKKGRRGPASGDGQL